MDLAKVIKAFMLQAQCNLEIDQYGQTDEKVYELENIVDSMSSSESDLFVELCLESKTNKEQVYEQIETLKKQLV